MTDDVNNRRPIGLHLRDQSEWARRSRGWSRPLAPQSYDPAERLLDRKSTFG
jgi:hypothetical protein